MKVVGSIGFTVNQGRCSRWSRDQSPRRVARSKAAEYFEDQKKISSDYHVGE
jgi:hypothetical protein